MQLSDTPTLSRTDVSTPRALSNLRCGNKKGVAKKLATPKVLSIQQSC